MRFRAKLRRLLLLMVCGICIGLEFGGSVGIGLFGFDGFVLRLVCWTGCFAGFACTIDLFVV